MVIAYQGSVAPEAIAAAGRIGEHRRDIGVLAVTSADRLFTGWTAAQRTRKHGNSQARSYIERLLAPLPRHCTIITVIDGHPATLAGLGVVDGHKAIPLGVEQFGQTGTIPDLYEHIGLEARSIVEAISGLTRGPGPVHHQFAMSA